MWCNRCVIDSIGACVCVCVLSWQTVANANGCHGSRLSERGSRPSPASGTNYVKSVNRARERAPRSGGTITRYSKENEAVWGGLGAAFTRWNVNGCDGWTSMFSAVRRKSGWELLASRYEVQILWKWDIPFREGIRSRCVLRRFGKPFCSLPVTFWPITPRWWGVWRWSKWFWKKTLLFEEPVSKLSSLSSSLGPHVRSRSRETNVSPNSNRWKPHGKAMLKVTADSNKRAFIKQQRGFKVQKATEMLQQSQAYEGNLDLKIKRLPSSVFLMPNSIPKVAHFFPPCWRLWYVCKRFACRFVLQHMQVWCCCFFKICVLCSKLWKPGVILVLRSHCSSEHSDRSEHAPLAIPAHPELQIPTWKIIRKQ